MDTQVKLSDESDDSDNEPIVKKLKVHSTFNNTHSVLNLLTTLL